MRSFLQWVESQSNLYQQLVALRTRMIQVVQKVYDEWEQGEECDNGGICDEIAREISSVISQSIPDANITEGGHDGDDHAWTIVYDEDESYGVDIPPDVYETGGGYCWKKIPDVKFQIDDVAIWNLGVHPSEFQEDW